jgi:hypothetical protein
MSNSRKRFNLFTGFEAGEITSSRIISAPGELICIAKPTSISYYSDKINGGGDGKLAIYDHRFSAKTLLYTDPAGTFLVIAGPNLRITQRGIVG